jgi:hypothetical protein
MNSERALREKALAAIASGKFHRLFGVPGSGAPCAICGEPLMQDEMEVQLQFTWHNGASDLDHYHLHYRCYTAVEFERTKNGTAHN